ncbi:MAG: 2-C-methyl-D-erythritol 4-phosphate cytidylyltransferase [Verrucomicrobiales bacterium]|jgi:2-C-methyl-D-erythritol 4-phosphate cytidylyltransferase
MSHANTASREEMTDLVWTIVVAGGLGLRFGGRKQFAELAGRSVVQRSVDAATSVSAGIIVVVPTDAVAEQRLSSTADLLVVAGGGTRAESVRAGLAQVPATATTILVHDAARPLATAELFAAIVDTIRNGAQAAVPAVAVADTIRQRSGGVIDRDELITVQTPQGFVASTLRSAHQSAGEATDDATLVEALGVTVSIVEGEPQNRKLTEPIDLVAASAIIDHLDGQDREPSP